MCHNNALAACAYGDVDVLALGRHLLEEGIEAIEGRAGVVEEDPLECGSHQYAAESVGWGVARMNHDAREVGHVLQEGHEAFVAG